MKLILVLTLSLLMNISYSFGGQTSSTQRVSAPDQTENENLSLRRYPPIPSSSWKKVTKIPGDHWSLEQKNQVVSVQFNPTWSLVLIATNKMVRIKSIGQNGSRGTLMMDGVRSAQFSPDGSKVLIFSLDSNKPYRIWNWELGNSAWFDLPNLKAPYLQADFSPDSKFLITSNLELVDLTSKEIAKTYAQETVYGRPYYVKYSNDGEKIFAFGDSQCLILSSKSGQVLMKQASELIFNRSYFSTPEYWRRRMGGTFSPDSQFVVIYFSSLAPGYSVWNLQNNTITSHNFTESNVYGLKFFPDRRDFIYAGMPHSNYGNLNHTPIERGASLTDGLLPQGGTTFVDISPDSRWMVTAKDKTVILSKIPQVEDELRQADSDIKVRK